MLSHMRNSSGANPSTDAEFAELCRKYRGLTSRMRGLDIECRAVLMQMRQLRSVREVARAINIPPATIHRRTTAYRRTKGTT